MNQEARDILVGAQLRNVRQARGAYHRRGKYFCAAGVLLDELITTKRIDAVWRRSGLFGSNEYALFDPGTGCEIDPQPSLLQHVDVGKEEFLQIQIANDDDKWSFLEIARKIGVKEEGHE